MKKMDNSVMITLMIVVAVVMIVSIVVSVVLRVMPTETLTADGVAEVEVMPDLISVNFNVETLGKSAAEAKDANAVIVSDVKNALVNLGFNRDEIVTQNFNVYEEFDWSRDEGRESIGFKASHGIRLEFSTEDIDLIGETVNAGVDNGALLSYINFELSTELQNEYKAEALKLAAQDARIKAEAIAEGLGAKVGRVVSTSSSDFNYYPRVAFAMDEGGAAVKGLEVETVIQPGEQTVSARVSVTYKLK